MLIVAILYFFAVTYLLGFTVSGFVKNAENFLERTLMRIGFGLSLLPLIGLILNHLRLPAHWLIILLLAAVYPLYTLILQIKAGTFGKGFSFKITNYDITIFLLLLIFGFSLWVYASGAFSYPWLEDDDPWSHAIGIKYIATEKTVFVPAGVYFHYFNPYPPSYDLLMGILHQVNPLSLYTTLKFFNALIISLSFVFFYFFIKELSTSRSKALFATFILASVPAYLSHFIWALALAVPLYFVVFYALERVAFDRRWWLVAGFAMITTLLSSPTHSAYFVLLYILYLGSKFIIHKKIPWPQIAAGALGAFLSVMVWWLPMIATYGFAGTLEGVGVILEVGIKGNGPWNAFSGTGDRVYSFSNFFAAQKQNMINNPIGIGRLVLILVGAEIILFFVVLSSSLQQNALLKPALIKPLKTLLIISGILFLLGSLFFVTSDALAVPQERYHPPLISRITLVLEATLLGGALLLIVLFFAAQNLKEEQRWIVLAMIWFLFAFYAVNAAPYKIKISPFRAWLIFAIPVSMLATQGGFYLAALGKKIGGTYGKYALLILLIAGVYFTSTQYKVAVNLAQWPPGGFWSSSEEISGFLWMQKNLPANSNVFSFVNDGAIIGLDMVTCRWCPQVRDFKKAGFNQSAPEIYEFLKQQNYEYVIIEGQFFKQYGPAIYNATQATLGSSPLFSKMIEVPTTALTPDGRTVSAFSLYRLKK